MLMPCALWEGTAMTKHSGATPPGNGQTTYLRPPAIGHDRGVSERIYAYIRAGRLDQGDHHGARPAPPSTRS
jgi:hypothetical protein